MDLIKYGQNCRVCLKANNAYKNIFSHIVEGYQEPVVQILFSLFNIELSPHKAYPQFICRKCLTELENILLFKEDLVRNQEFLFGLFKAAYPNCVEKSDPDFFTLTENFNKQYAQNTSLECCDFDKSVVIKSESLSVPQVDNPAEQDAQFVCKNCNKTSNSNEILNNRSSTYRTEQAKKDNINVRMNKENVTRHSKTKHVKTDENSNISCKNVQYQEEQTHSIEGDMDDVNKVEIPITSTQDSHSETVIPQVSFLQKLDLITLEDAKNLKTRPKPLLRTRRRFVSKKLKLPKGATTSVGNLQSREVRSISTSRKNQLDDEGSPDTIINRSVNFLTRYGCRKLNKTCLKQFKSILQGDTILTVHQDYNTPNKQNEQVSKKKELSLGSNFLFNKSNESKAVSKQKGCEHVNSLQNNNSSEKRGSSKLKLGVNNIRDYKRVDSFKDINCDICPTEQSEIDKKKKITQNIMHLGLSPKKEESVSSNHIRNADLLVKSKSRDDIPATLYEHESPGEYRPIPSINFYESDSSHTITKPSYRTSAVVQSIGRRTLKKLGSVTSIKTDNSSVKTEKPIINDFNTTLYRSTSLDTLSDFKKEIKEDILSVDDSSALVPNNVLSNDPLKLEKTVGELKSEPLTYISSGDLRQMQSYKSGWCKSFGKVNTTETETPGEDPISLLNSVNNVEFNLGPKRNKYWVDIKTSSKTAEPTPALTRKKGMPEKFDVSVTGACSNSTKVIDIATKKVGTTGILSDIFNNKSQEFVRREIHDYSLRSKIPSKNISFRSKNISVEKKQMIKEKLELKKSITCADQKERSTCQRPSRWLIRQTSGLSEIKTESSDEADEISELSQSRLLDKPSCGRRTSCQPASRGLVRQKPELSQIKTESSNNADAISELSWSQSENHTNPLGMKSKVVSVLQKSVTRKTGNSPRLRSKLKKTACSENLSVLRAETPSTQDCQKFKETNIPLVNGYGGTSERNVLMGKVQKINMSEDDELHLTITRTNLKQGKASENISNFELHTYPETRSKLANEKSNSCICEPPKNLELIRNGNYFHKISRSCTDLSDRTNSEECKRKVSSESAPCSKRKRRPPVKYSPISYEKPRVYYYKGYIKERYPFGNKKS